MWWWYRDAAGAAVQRASIRTVPMIANFAVTQGASASRAQRRKILYHVPHYLDR